MNAKHIGGRLVKELLHSKKLVYSIIALILGLTIILAGVSCKSTTTTTAAPTTTTATTTITTAATSSPLQTTTAPPTTPKVTAKTGGTLKIYLPTEPFSLYPPVMTGQTDGENANLCIETLFRLDEQGNIVGQLATDYVTDTKANTFTIHLRKNVKFSDGSDFNAAVVKWNLQQYQAGSKAELKNVTSIDTPDDYTVVLTTKTFDNTLVINLSTAADAGRIVSQKSFDANGGKTWADKNPVGTGPFKFVSWTKDVSIIYSRYDGYWGGKPYLDGVQYIRISDATTAQMSFVNGDIDIYGPDPVIAKPLIDSGKYNSCVTPEGQFPALGGFYTEDATSPFSKLEVRQAMSYAINPKAISDAFGYGFWKVSNQWAIPGTWGYNSAVKGYPFDPAKAKQLLAAAGFTTPLKMTLSYYGTSQAVTDENTALQKMLNDAGFEVTLNLLQRPAFADMATNGKGWTGIVRMQGYSSIDPLVKYANVARGLEFKGVYLPQEFVDTYYQAIAAPDFATKEKLTQQLMYLAIDKYCMMSPLYIQGSPMIKQKRVMDDGFGIFPYRYLNPFTWIN